MQKGRKKFEAVSCEDSASAATASGSLASYPKSDAALKLIDAVGATLRSSLHSAVQPTRRRPRVALLDSRLAADQIRCAALDTCCRLSRRRAYSGT